MTVLNSAWVNGFAHKDGTARYCPLRGGKTSTKAFQVFFDVVSLTNKNKKKPEYSQSSKSSWPSSKYKDRPVRKKTIRGKLFASKPIINIPSLYSPLLLQNKRYSSLEGFQVDKYNIRTKSPTVGSPINDFDLTDWPHITKMKLYAHNCWCCHVYERKTSQWRFPQSHTHLLTNTHSSI